MLAHAAPHRKEDALYRFLFLLDKFPQACFIRSLFVLVWGCLMEPQGYVDGAVADWQMEEDDRVGCDLAGLVVYIPASMQKKHFERSCDWLEQREEALRDALLDTVKLAKGGLGVIDQETADKAWSRVNELMGDDTLHLFIKDTRTVAHLKVGAALKMAAMAGIDVTPGTADGAVDVVPAMSFMSERAMAHYLREGRGGWKPSVRLSVRVSMEGPYGPVTAAAAALLAATAECGPVLAWRQNVRPAGARAKSVPRLRLVAQ